jgi:PhnB protein
MKTTPKTLPENTSIVIPRLVCADPVSEIEFCMSVFAAEDLNRRPGPDGQIAHALLKIGPSMIMIEREWPSLPSRAPRADGSTPVIIFVYVLDVDATVDRAAAAGAKVLVPVADQFWGDRTAWIMDPAGHVWTVATRIEEPTEDVRAQRWSSMLAEQTKNKQ